MYRIPTTRLLGKGKGKAWRKGAYFQFRVVGGFGVLFFFVGASVNEGAPGF